MYRFDNLHPTNIEELYEQIDSYDIFRTFFGEFDETRKYLSPFREEKDPSFQISYYDGEWVYRDFGESNNPRNAVNFVMRDKDLNYREAIDLIYRTLKGKSKPPEKKEVKKEIIKPSSVRFSKKLTQAELDYFAQGNITKETLLHFKTYSCKELWYDGRMLSTTTVSKPLVVYLFEPNVWKVYGPNHAQNKKFFSWNIANHLQGYDLLPKTGHILFITKSYKDIMTLYEIGYPAIAPHSENGLIEPWLMTDLQQRFRYIYMFYDNDKTGIEKSTMMTELYHLYYINVPHDLNTLTKETKDPFDVVKNYDQSMLKDILHDRFETDDLEYG
jgi:DNA primase